jgi:hypothetical protein
MKKTVLILAIIFPLILTAQQKPSSEKKIYVSPEGKIYVNRNLPVYLWLSTSASDNSQKYRLNSEATSKYSNPMYFDSEGYNSFRSPSAIDTATKAPVLPTQDVVFEVFADSENPLTKFNFGESVPFKQQDKLYVKSDTKLSLTAKDAQSGVESIYYSVDGSAYTKYSQPITFAQEKEYSVKFFSVDNVGNSENEQELKIVYDKSAPVTKYIVSGDENENVVSGRSKIEFKAEDNGIGVHKIFYKIDENKEVAYQAPIITMYLEQGEHTVTYYATDKAGNRENDRAYIFYVDKTAPTIIEEVIAKTFFANGKEYASGKAQLKLTAFDNKAGIKEIRYRINGGDYQLYEKPVFLSNSSGSQVIESYAVDKVNNTSQAQVANQKTTIPYIDLSGPNLKYSFTGPVFTTRDTMFISRKTKITLKAADQEAGINRIEYRVDGKENLTFSDPFSISGEGVHTIDYVGYDNVENSNSSKFFVKVDTTGPEIKNTFSILPIATENSKEVYPKYVVLFLSGTDSETGLENIKYSLGAAAATVYSIAVTGFSTGEKTVKITATDKLGNTTEKTINFIIKE